MAVLSPDVVSFRREPLLEQAQARALFAHDQDDRISRFREGSCCLEFLNALLNVDHELAGTLAQSLYLLPALFSKIDQHRSAAQRDFFVVRDVGHRGASSSCLKHSNTGLHATRSNASRISLAWCIWHDRLRGDAMSVVEE